MCPKIISCRDLMTTYSNDGSFAERFKQMQSEADEKRKQQEAIEKKKEFDSSFRMRGKRKKAAADQTNGGSVAKKAKEEALDEELDPSASAYLREMRKMKEKLPGGDQGSGVRPLVK
ncbi:hypothetical protein DFJ77DRAFT_441123 [Powellomyces hirtus]|nr:hypothetical protein DFJ77DRAFT_441123 [Powellomyces hirtus]